MNLHLPKVLIFGQTFNDFSGGGITLSNLFKDWPMESLAVVSYPFMLHNSSKNICQNYYQIGKEELKWIFPLSLVKQNFKSGQLELGTGGRVPVLVQSRNMRHFISARILTPVIRWSGLVHCVSTIRLSPGLKEWLSDFAPDILYLQISNRESINFAIELIDYLEVPSVLHMMDDWPATISGNGPFKQHWHRVIDREFRHLLEKADAHLSISEAMAEAYLERYNKSFRAFHNPVVLDQFNIESKPDRSKRNRFRVLYLGRIGTANSQSIVQFAKFIANYDKKGLEIEFDIYSKDHDSRSARIIAAMDKVNIRPAIGHDDIPVILKAYDLLLLPLDFTYSALKFSRLSIPTKASEYMASGTPILVFAPSETAISRFFAEKKCGHCLVSNANVDIEKAMDLLLENITYRHDLGERARIVADRLFNARTVRDDFRVLISTARRTTPER